MFGTNLDSLKENKKYYDKNSQFIESLSDRNGRNNGT